MGAAMIPLVLMPALAAGVIQTVTGFGGGIIMMLFFPLFLPMLKASALSTLITLYLTGTLAFRLRKSAVKKQVMLPLAFFFVTSAAAIHLASQMQTRWLSMLFGGFLVALSVYFFFFSETFRLRACPRNSIICGALSGLTSGLFGISGPPIVVYFLAVLGDDKETYLATTQTFFFLCSLYTTGVRIAKGILTADLLPLFLVGLVGILLGKRLGLFILARINAKTMKKVVYVFLAVSGVITLAKNLF